MKPSIGTGWRRRKMMCLSCGCKQPDERHGDDRNIVMDDLKLAAEAAGVSAKDVVRNIQEGFEVGGAQSRTN
jgi:hypothetical protein